MQLTQHTDYALRTLIFLLGRPGELVGTRAIAEFYRISPDHLMKVAKSLTQAGWLVSSRGASGGIALAPHTADARVGDIVRHTESLDLLECFQLATNTCPILQRCRLRGLLYQAREAFLAVLDSVTVRELAMTPPLLAAAGLGAATPPPPTPAPGRKRSAPRPGSGAPGGDGRRGDSP